jgi:hypothetical protein
MTKHGGKYYLQYAAPGTQHNVYANGTYVGDHPLGPFTYAPYNPVSYKPGGFMAGAGHGNTFRDRFGNYWNTGAQPTRHPGDRDPERCKRHRGVRGAGGQRRRADHDAAMSPLTLCGAVGRSCCRAVKLHSTEA